MSKSLGNVIAPSEINDKYGAEILRLWVASSDYTGEISLGEKILKELLTLIAASETRSASCLPTPATSTSRKMPSLLKKWLNWIAGPLPA